MVVVVLWAVWLWTEDGLVVIGVLLEIAWGTGALVLVGWVV